MVGLETVRREWEEESGRLEQERRDPRRYETLHAQREVVLAELRRRVGQNFSLAELAAAYDDAERWARESVLEHAPSPGWARDLTMVLGAAFHAYRTGAADYRP